MKKVMTIAAVAALGLFGTAHAQTKKQIERELAEYFTYPCMVASLSLGGFSLEESRSIAKNQSRWNDVVPGLKEYVEWVEKSLFQMNIQSYTFNERKESYMFMLGSCVKEVIDLIEESYRPQKEVKMKYKLEIASLFGEFFRKHPEHAEWFRQEFGERSGEPSIAAECYG